MIRHAERRGGLRVDLWARDDGSLAAVRERLPELLEQLPRLGGPEALGPWEARAKGGPLSRGPARRHALRRWLLRRSPPRRAEHEHLLWLRARLFRAPEPLASLVLWRGPRLVAQWLWVERWDDHRSLEEVWPTADDRTRATLLEELARELARLHTLRFTHQDLFPRNLLVGPADAARRLAWIDAWAGGVAPRGRGPAADLGCLFLEAAGDWSPEQQRRFLATYCATRGSLGRRVDAERLLADAVAVRARLHARLVREPVRQRGRPLPPEHWDPWPLLDASGR